MSKASSMAGSLTSRELEFLVAYVKEATSTAIDWQKVADATNSKTAKYARDQFAQVRKKLLRLAPAADGDGDDAAGGDVSTPNGKTKVKATPRKRKTGSDADDEETPVKAKKTKTTAKKADDAVVKDEPNEAGELMDELS